MKTLCWNVRGMGNTWAFWEICDEIKRLKLDLCFLLEAKCNGSLINKLKLNLNYFGCFWVDSLGSRGV